MKYAFCIAGSLFTLLAWPLAAQSDWKLRKEKDGIQVFFRDGENTAIKELMIKARIEGTVSAATALMSDVEYFPDWVDNCIEARVISRRSATDYTYYQLIKFPWPFANREFVMHCRINQDPKTHAVYFRSIAMPDAHPPVKGNFRVQQTESQWKMQPDGPEHLQIEYRLKTDPGEGLPAWVVNMALEKGPINTVRFMRETLGKEPYVNKRPSFIKDFVE